MENLFSSINGLFDKFKNKASTVALNVSSRSVLEVLEFNHDGTITNYAAVPIQYNAFTKELENTSDFESAIKRTFSELNISLNSKAYIALPTFVIENTSQIPREDDAEAINSMLTALVETNYIFKKYDAAISYYRLPDEEVAPGNMSLTYTAMRADEYAKIINVLETVGLKIVAVDSSFSALINGVIAKQTVNPVNLDNNKPWTIINITSNSFIIFSMKGRNLVDVYEEPLAVKSFTQEEIYQVITNSLDLVKEKLQTDQIIITSQSDDISAEYLAEILQVETSITYIEDNKYRKPLLEYGYNITQSNKTKISLEAIGIVSWPFNENGFKFNFLGETKAGEVAFTVDTIYIPMNGKEIPVTVDSLRKIVIIFAILVLSIMFVAFGLSYALYHGIEQENTTLATEVTALEAELQEKPAETGVSEAKFLQDAYNNNLDFKKSYSAVADEIPKMLWIEELQLSETSKLYMTGRSYRMDDILNYYDSLKKLGKYSNLKISVLKISNTPISYLLNSDMKEETTYEFAFGETFFVDPREIVANPTEEGKDVKKEDKKDDAVPAVPGAPAEDIPPAPTNIPKQDK